MFKAHIKLIVLKELSKESLSGYDLMRYIGKLGEKPSPGYIYPLLNDLEVKGFISVKQKDRRKIYSITVKGKKLLDDLQKSREDMIKKVTKVWRSIADKDDFDVFIRKNKDFFRDKVLLAKFHTVLFSVYKDNANRKKIRIIVEEAIKKMERLK